MMDHEKFNLGKVGRGRGDDGVIDIQSVLSTLRWDCFEVRD